MASTKQKLYSKNDITKAIQLVDNGWTVKRAALECNIPRSTLILNIKGWKNRPKCLKNSVGRPIELSLETERKLAENIETMNKWGFGLTRREILDLVHVYLTKNNVPNRFKESRPGKDWFIGFSKRWNFSCKRPIKRQIIRTEQTQPNIIYGFFDLLEKTLEELGIGYKPNQIFNLDETSICHDPNSTKVVSTKNKAVFRSTFGTGRTNTSVLFCVSADGEKLPPYILYKAKHLSDTWMPSEAYPGTGYRATPHGWMTEDAFFHWFKYMFLKSCPKERPLLIILDGHISHISIPLIQLATAENITLLKLPPHTTHIIQPLDSAVFNVLKKRWDELLTIWQREHYGQSLGKADFSILLGNVWRDLSSIIIKKGFELTGIYPTNRRIIKEDIFKAADLQEYKDSIANKENVSDNIPTSSASKATPVNTAVTDVSGLDLGHSLQRPKVSFENLLLQKIERRPTNIKKRSKIHSNTAEIITREEYLRELNQKNTTPKNKSKTQTNKCEERQESTTDESDFSVHDSDSSTGPFIEEEELSDDFNTIVTIGSWVLVTYSTKKSLKRYVGQVLEKSGETVTVKFLRRKTHYFVWPATEDIDEVNENDVFRVLQEPKQDKRGHFEFSITFDKTVL